MKQFSRTLSVLTAAALAATGMLGVATSASASSPPTPQGKQITCPDKSPSVIGEYDYVLKNGTVVNEYYASNGNPVTVHRIDGHYEAFSTDGASFGRICFDKDPGRIDGMKPAEVQMVGGGGGGVSSGYFYFGGVNFLATTVWVKWKVSVN